MALERFTDVTVSHLDKKVEQLQALIRKSRLDQAEYGKEHGQSAIEQTKKQTQSHETKIDKIYDIISDILAFRKKLKDDVEALGIDLPIEDDLLEAIKASTQEMTEPLKTESSQLARTIDSTGEVPHTLPHSRLQTS